MESIDIIQELSQNFIDSAYDVNTNRAFPDARDGLKPGQRCILWEMYKRGYTSKKPHVKSAKIDGGVAANWWPHGTTAIYETFVRMSQPFTNNLPEVNFHGSNGNVILGADSFAADRYTEARLAPIAEDGLLQGINKNAVDMTLNFSEDEEMPTVLPAVFPRLLVNGSQGIGVSVANTWTLYNFQEIADCIIAYLKDGTTNFELYPDYPTGGVIINKDDMTKILKTGKGKVIVEAKYDIHGREIRFTEFPYQVYIEPLVEEIKKGIDEDKIHNILSVDNKSDKKQILLSVVCSSAAQVERTLSELFQYTSLRTQYNVNQMAIVSKTPTLLTFMDMLEIYKEHNLSCIKREHQFELNKTRERIEILQGYKVALENIDDFISIIRTSDSPQDEIKSKYDLTDNQIDAILAMKLSRLSKMEVSKILQELEEKKKLAAKLEKIVGSEKEQIKVLIKRLTSLVKQYGTPRRTQVIQKTIAAKTSSSRKAPAVENVVIALTANGYIKSIPVAKFRPNGSVREERTTTDKTVNLFSSLGKAYRLKVSAIKQGLNSEKGNALGAILKLEQGESILDFSVEDTEKQVYFATKLGKVKLLETKLVNGTTQNLRGSSIIKLTEGDSIEYLKVVDDTDKYATLATSDNRRLCFNLSQLSASGKASSGRKGISLSDGCMVTEAKLSKEPVGVVANIGTRGKVLTG